MAKGLKTLIRLHKWTVDEKRRALVALQAREEQVITEIRQAEEQLVAEKKIAAEDVTGAGFLYGQFANAWLDRRSQLNRTLDVVRAEVARAADELADAYGQLKTFEITQRERERRAKAEADKKEQEKLDEIGLTLYRRRETDEG